MDSDERLQALAHMWTTRKDDYALVPVGVDEHGLPRYAIEDHANKRGVLIDDHELAEEVKRRMLAAGVFVGNPDTIEFKKVRIKARFGK